MDYNDRWDDAPEPWDEPWKDAPEPTEAQQAEYKAWIAELVRKYGDKK